MRLFLIPITLGLTLLVPATPAQDNALFSDIVVLEDEAFLDLSADADTTWDLLLHQWGEDALSWPQRSLLETWVVVEDLWLRLESLPYRQGTWTRVRVRIGDFRDDVDRQRAESMLYQLAVDLEALQAVEQAEARELAALQAAATVGPGLGGTLDAGAPYATEYARDWAKPWVPYGLMFSPEWLQWGWPWFYAPSYYQSDYVFYRDRYWDAYWHDPYNHDYGWGGSWWWDSGCADQGWGDCDDDCDDGDGGGDTGDDGGGGDDGDGPLNPPIVRWGGLDVTDNLPGLTGRFAGGPGSGRDTGSQGTGDPDGDAGPGAVGPSRSIVVGKSTGSAGRRSIALSPLPPSRGGLRTISTSGFGMSSSRSAAAPTARSSGSDFGWLSSASVRTVPIISGRRGSTITSSSSLPGRSTPSLGSASRLGAPSPRATASPSMPSPRSVSSRAASSRSTPARAAPARSTPSRARPSSSTPAPRASSSSSRSSSRPSSTPRSSSRSSSSGSRSSSSSSGRSSGRGGA